MINQTIIRRVETNDETLKRVNICSERELREFTSAVPEISNIRTLEIEDTAMDPDVVTALSAILPRMPFLGKFFMNNCDCSNANGLAILASALANKTSLELLRLWHCQIGHNGADMIASSLSNNSTLKELDLDDNSIGDEGAIALSPLFSSNSSIKYVDLMRNSIGADGISALAASLCDNRSVEAIELRGNTDEPSTHFNPVLYNDASIESVIASNHTLLDILPTHPDLEPLLELNEAGPEKAARSKIIRFLNEQPTFVLTMGIEGNLLPSYMAKIGRDCRLNTIFELIRNMPALFETE